MKQVLAFILILASHAAYSLDVPPLKARVTDNAGIFTADEREKLEAKLKAHEESSTDQIAVLTVAGLQGESIESFSMKVAQAWKIGTKKNDNGVIVVYSPNDHKIRIEVGRGLEGKLTDGQCGDIIREKFAPSTKAKRYYEGFDNGTTAIVQAIAGEYKAVAASSGGDGLWFLWVLLIAAGVIGVVVFIVKVFTREDKSDDYSYTPPATPHSTSTAYTAAVLSSGATYAATRKRSSGSGHSSSSSPSSSSSSSSYSSDYGSSSSSYDSGSSSSSYDGGGGSFDGGGASGDA